MKIKVCGMRDPQNILELAKLRPDYMGFLFWPNSKRFISQKTPFLPKSIKKVGVFVNETLEILKSKARDHNLNGIQLHGDESPKFCQNVKELGLEVIKVFSIGRAFDFEKIEEFEECCDYFLLDSKGLLPGGNGHLFDWELLTSYKSKKPFFLSGGIGPEHAGLIKEMIGASQSLYGIDINSRFELHPGIKDIQRIKNFMQELSLL